MMSKYIDFHSHSQNSFDSEVIALPTYRLGVDEIPPYMPMIWVGIHPYDCDIEVDFANQLALYSSRVVGIGEIGLDYYHNSDNIEQQNTVFITQLKEAIKLNYPITIHCVRGYNKLLEILKSFENKLPPIVLHSFIGSVQLSESFAKLGCYFSFSPSSFASHKTVKTISVIPLERIFLESDDEKIDIKQLYKIFLQYRTENMQEIIDALYNNFKNVVNRWQIG